MFLFLGAIWNVAFWWLTPARLVSFLAFAIVALIMVPETRQYLFVKAVIWSGYLWLWLQGKRGEEEGSRPSFPDPEDHEQHLRSLANPQHTLLGEIAISNPARVDVHHSRRFIDKEGDEPCKLGTFSLFRLRRVRISQCAFHLSNRTTGVEEAKFPFSGGKVIHSRSAHTLKVVNANSELLYVQCATDAQRDDWIKVINHNIHAEVAAEWANKVRQIRKVGGGVGAVAAAGGAGGSGSGAAAGGAGADLGSGVAAQRARTGADRGEG